MISNQCSYALRAVLELGKREGSGPVAISEIAEAQEIPVRFLQAILRQLKQAGLLDSVRGKRGGYELARKAGTIRVEEIVSLIDGPMIGTRGGHDGPPASAELFAEIWQDAQEAVSGVFTGITVRDLVSKEQAIRDRFVANYSI